MYSCMYYNLHVAASVTTQGRSLVSTLGMFFEQFLSNNVKFGSMNEVVMFIHNVLSEKPNRRWKDYELLDSNVTIQDCFAKIAMTCGFEWIPTEDELQAIWDILVNLSQEDINRLYYKNNLYEFITRNSKIIKMIKMLLKKLYAPFLNPNKCPKEIEVEIEVFKEVLREYVFYNYHIIDRIDRMDNMIKNVTAISDTDSTIVSFDAWYNCILNIVRADPDMDNIRVGMDSVDAVEYIENNHIQLVEYIEPQLDYDFFSEEVIEVSRAINLTSIIPQDCLRYTIINILAYCVSDMVNDYMISYCKASNSYDGDCLIIAKNEFLFKMALLTDHKKNYATLQELQEGHMVPKEEQLDQKGLAISKSSLNENTRDALEKILYEDILNAKDIDRVAIIKHMAILEDKIYKSLSTGQRDYYKPVTIKSISSYEDPYKIQGIKAAIAWNYLHDGTSPIDLRERNGIDIVKVNITPESAEKVKEVYPELYYRIMQLLNNPNCEFYSAFKGQIKSLAVPKDVPVPKWVTLFINYTEIINDNLKNFPLKSIGIMRQGKDKNIAYTNIVKI